MVLEWTPEEASLLQDRPFSLLQRQSTSQAKHGRLRTTRHFPASVYWVPGSLGPGDRRLCMRLVLVSFTLFYSCIIIPLWDTPRSTFLCLIHLKRVSETDIFLLGTRAPRDRRSECIKSFTFYLHTLSAACASYINVCVGYMCFVKLQLFMRSLS